MSPGDQTLPLSSGLSRSAGESSFPSLCLNRFGGGVGFPHNPCSDVPGGTVSHTGIPEPQRGNTCKPSLPPSLLLVEEL